MIIVKRKIKNTRYLLVANLYQIALQATFSLLNALLFNCSCTVSASTPFNTHNCLVRCVTVSCAKNVTLAATRCTSRILHIYQAALS